MKSSRKKKTPTAKNGIICKIVIIHQVKFLNCNQIFPSSMKTFKRNAYKDIMNTNKLLWFYSKIYKSSPFQVSKGLDKVPFGQTVAWEYTSARFQFRATYHRRDRRWFPWRTRTCVGWLWTSCWRAWLSWGAVWSLFRGPFWLRSQHVSWPSQCFPCISGSHCQLDRSSVCTFYLETPVSRPSGGLLAPYPVSLRSRSIRHLWGYMLILTLTLNDSLLNCSRVIISKSYLNSSLASTSMSPTLRGCCFGMRSASVLDGEASVPWGAPGPQVVKTDWTLSIMA